MKTLHLLRRFPVTISLLLMLAVVAVLTNSHVTQLEPDWLVQLGFSARDFWEVRWGRFLTSALVTLGGNVFWQAMGMVMLAVGAAEYLTGSKSALVTFWGIHIITLLAEGAIVGPLLHWLVFDGDSLLLLARDVGPSAGYFGSLGLAVAALPVHRHWHTLLAVAVFIGLIRALFLPSDPGEDSTLKMLADIAHILAFPLGLAAWRLRRAINQHVSTTAAQHP